MEILYGLGFLILFSLSAIGGVALRARLPEEHLSNENMDAIRLVTGLLVTFAALVLSLQLSTARTTYNAATTNRSAYAAQLSSLDNCLRGLGPAMDATRLQLRRYVAAVIASTWPDEPAPRVEGMPDARRMAIRGEDATLTGIMNGIGLALDAVSPETPAGVNTAQRCRSAVLIYVALRDD